MMQVASLRAPGATPVQKSRIFFQYRTFGRQWSQEGG
jgi:hypothetical protein